jgi:hypothetical protein
MKTVKHNRRNLALVLVAVLFSATMLTSGGVLGQTGAQQCPNPRRINLTQSSGAATPVMADFPKGLCPGGIEPNFGGTKVDRCFIHTFSFPPPSELCCQCVEGKGNTLTLKLRVLLGGPAGSSTAANDQFAIYSNGSFVTGTNQPLYSGSVTTGQVVTKTIALKCSWLNNNRLSFLTQDDTAVLSATLNLNTCCVKK